MEPIKVIREDKYTIKIKYDEVQESPREWDNLSKMVCFHKRYRLGDYNCYNQEAYSDWDELEQDIMESENVRYISPLYMYEHSGIAIRMSPFGDRFDSGQIGFVYVTVEDAQQLSDEQILNSLNSEIETYNAYLNGDVYYYSIYEEQVCNLGCTHEEFVDSCGCYYDIDHCIAEAKEQIKYYQTQGVL